MKTRKINEFASDKISTNERRKTMKQSIIMLAIVCLPLAIMALSYTPSVNAAEGCNREVYHYFNSLFDCEKGEHDGTSQVYELSWAYDECNGFNPKFVALYTDVRDAIHTEYPEESEFTVIPLTYIGDGQYTGTKTTTIGSPYPYDRNHKAEDQIVEEVLIRPLDDNMQMVSGGSSFPFRPPYVSIYYTAYEQTEVRREPPPSIPEPLVEALMPIFMFAHIPLCVLGPILYLPMAIFNDLFQPNYVNGKELTNPTVELLQIEDMQCN